MNATSDNHIVHLTDLSRNVSSIQSGIVFRTNWAAGEVGELEKLVR